MCKRYKTTTPNRKHVCARLGPSAFFSGRAFEPASFSHNLHRNRALAKGCVIDWLRGNRFLLRSVVEGLCAHFFFGPPFLLWPPAPETRTAVQTRASPLFVTSRLGNVQRSRTRSAGRPEVSANGKSSVAFSFRDQHRVAPPRTVFKRRPTFAHFLCWKQPNKCG